MHNTSTKYQQMHDSWILIFICFVGRFLLEPSASSSSSFIIASFLIQELSSSYSSLLEGSSLDGKSLIFSCSHLLFPSYESIFFFFSKSTKSNHFLLAHIPWMNESHDPRRPFKVAVTTSSFTTSSCSLIWEILMTAWSLHSGSSHSSTVFSKSYYDLCSSP